MMTERKIGEIFEKDGVRLVCLPLTKEDAPRACRNCAFAHRPKEWCKEMACIAIQREDKANVFFRPLNDMGDDFHYSKRLDKVLQFVPVDDPKIGQVCKLCALGQYKTATWTDCCEGALCISFMRKDRQDGYFVQLGENTNQKPTTK